MRAVAKLTATHPDVRLVIAVGKAPKSLQHDFERAYKKLQGYLLLNGVDEVATVRTFELDEMAELYQGSDIFVLPSENETFGQVYIEAMACGVAVIGTKVGGIPEIISSNENGFLITPNDATSLAQHIEALLDDDKLRSHFVTTGRQTVNKKFTAKTQFDSFIQSLQKIIVS